MKYLSVIHSEVFRNSDPDPREIDLANIRIDPDTRQRQNVMDSCLCQVNYLTKFGKKKSTNNCMTDARIYCKMSYLVMLRKIDPSSTSGLGSTTKFNNLIIRLHNCNSTAPRHFARNWHINYLQNVEPRSNRSCDHSLKLSKIGSRKPIRARCDAVLSKPYI